MGSQSRCRAVSSTSYVRRIDKLYEKSVASAFHPRFVRCSIAAQSQATHISLSETPPVSLRSVDLIALHQGGERGAVRPAVESRGKPEIFGIWLGGRFNRSSTAGLTAPRSPLNQQPPLLGAEPEPPADKTSGRGSTDYSLFPSLGRQPEPPVRKGRGSVIVLGRQPEPPVRKARGSVIVLG